MTRTLPSLPWLCPSERSLSRPTTVSTHSCSDLRGGGAAGRAAEEGTRPHWGVCSLRSAWAAPVPSAHAREGEAQVGVKLGLPPATRRGYSPERCPFWAEFRDKSTPPSPRSIRLARRKWGTGTRSPSGPHCVLSGSGTYPGKGFDRHWGAPPGIGTARSRPPQAYFGSWRDPLASRGRWLVMGKGMWAEPCLPPPHAPPTSLKMVERAGPV